MTFLQHAPSKGRVCVVNNLKELAWLTRKRKLRLTRYDTKSRLAGNLIKGKNFPQTSVLGKLNKIQNLMVSPQTKPFCERSLDITCVKIVWD